MTLQELKTEVRKYQYFEDDSVIDVGLATIVATRLKLGDPIWLTLIAPSSGGKSQILRPLSLTDPKFMHRIDDLTENTFLSGAPGKDKNLSLLKRIGGLGMLVISDLTVLFSKNTEARNAILSQFRMLYDGEMIKYVGTKEEPEAWKGYLSVIAGSTPSIYSQFEEVADMGERFIYYRMKPHDEVHAARLAMNRGQGGKETDDKLSGVYFEYLKGVVEGAAGNMNAVVIPEWFQERIIKVAQFAEKARATAPMDWKESAITKIPIPAMCVRAALQLTALARGLAVMRGADGLGGKDIEIIEWCGWSLANEEKRSVLTVLASAPHDSLFNTSTLADRIGLPTESTSKILQMLMAVGLVSRTSAGNELLWGITSDEHVALIRRITGVSVVGAKNRATSSEEVAENDAEADEAFRLFETSVV